MGEIIAEMMEDRDERGLPPGFRFHPTDEELVSFYLASKVLDSGGSPIIEIPEIDLNKCEPWDLPDKAKLGEREWYMYSLRDRKYPTSLRTNRLTVSGYWKATGKDREIYSSCRLLIGLKKTLVFYLGRAPRGEKTKWILHEYRLDGAFVLHHLTEEWVICRVFHKGGARKKIQPPVAAATSSLPSAPLPSAGQPLSQPVLDTFSPLISSKLQQPVFESELFSALMGWDGWAS